VSDVVPLSSAATPLLEEERRASRWTIAPAPPAEAAQELARQLQLPVEVCALLLVRGFDNADAAKKYLKPGLDALHDGALMLGMSAAVDRLQRAIEAGELILVHGDYDVDGICATSLLTRFIRGVGGRVLPFVPRRLEDGYDLGDAGVRAAIESGASVVVTCDCGTTAVGPVARLAEAGVDVIVTDHHLPAHSGVPRCVAVLNPRQRECAYPDKDLAGVGVAFKLAMELARRMGVPDSEVLKYIDLVALATVADVAPLRGENRAITRAGLRAMRDTVNPGLRALLRSSGLSEKPITAGRIGFILAPRINAVGRVGRAMRGVDLLLTEADPEANGIARELEEMNRIRQEIDRATLDAAREMLRAAGGAERRGIVLASEDWHPGVIGIVASRIVEETGRPTVLIAVKDGVGKGSGRSIPAFDLHGGLSECSELLMKFGGHRAAAGITIQPGMIAEFASRFDHVVHAAVSDEDFIPEVRIDMTVRLAESDIDALERFQKHFEPFGPANPGPVYAAFGVEVSRRPRKVGESGLRFSVRDAGRELDAIGWSLQPRMESLSPGARIDLVFRLERDDWNGYNRLQARVLDFRSA
jgi:single-stranded-DNA-specific exonuclease